MFAAVAGFALKRALPWFLGNWTWAIPCLLLAIVTVDNGIQRIRVANLQAAAANHAAQQAIEVAKAEKRVRDALEADAKLGTRLTSEYAAEVATLQGSLQDALVQLARAQRRPECDRTPASDAYDNFLRKRYGPLGAPAPQPPAAGRTDKPVP